jgi:hypothetical protein
MLLNSFQKFEFRFLLNFLPPIIEINLHFISYDIRSLATILNGVLPANIVQIGTLKSSWHTNLSVIVGNMIQNKDSALREFKISLPLFPAEGDIVMALNPVFDALINSSLSSFSIDCDKSSRIWIDGSLPFYFRYCIREKFTSIKIETANSSCVYIY